ncbi:nucleotide sugar dehydrogenase [Staphylococcus equorum]|uniref:nucleotide sugar dehydrogenase n=1 Tax=Staphylococcus equorum TaxID=246432 RepID=UPI002554978A|nr:nucleotide sugar dehydrogenase [Staphylococcus equorum]MDK9864300.1 nucleotide sugar dehydrogenase [Staphylococcus equorum]
MNKKIAIVGLGYVGLPVAVAFGKKHKVIGFDINEKRIKELTENYDKNEEISIEDLKQANIDFTSHGKKLYEADFIIISVPTPIDKHNVPNLNPLLNASETVGKYIKKGTIIVYESTVYPGATEEECTPVLEKASGLISGEDFFVGYSPERINPGDKKNTFETITKVVSGQNNKVLEEISTVYSSVVTAGTYKASSIKVAEASKIIENTQRDINIALMNELAIIFDKLNIDTNEVIEASSTKWNFLHFKPGLVGGHCIGVDPYYLIHKAQEVGHYPDFILSGRRTNESLANHIVTNVIKQLLKQGKEVHGASVNLLGLTFKANCPDLRNTKIIHIINQLKDLGLDFSVNDPRADHKEVYEFFKIVLKCDKNMQKSDVLIFAVPHKEYLNHKSQYLNMVKNNGVVIDLTGYIKKEDINSSQKLWRL